MVKNKVAAPFRVAEFDILYGEGISKAGELLDLGVEHRLITKSGTWLSYGDARLGQGRENARAFLKEHPEVMTETRGEAARHAPDPRPAGLGRRRVVTAR